MSSRCVGLTKGFCSQDLNYVAIRHKLLGNVRISEYIVSRLSITRRTKFMSKITPSSADSSKKALYVLDTNILLHDPFALFKFEEHDVFIPMVTVEEMDNKKSGTADINRNARQATRSISVLMDEGEGSIEEGFALNSLGNLCSGRMYIETQQTKFDSDEHFQKNDNLYLVTLRELLKLNKQDGKWSKIVMVSKDLNLRIKAIAHGFLAEDYRHDHAVSDADLLYTGMKHLDVTLSEYLTTHKTEHSIHNTLSIYEVEPIKDEAESFTINQFLCFKSEVEGKPGPLYRVVGLPNQPVGVSSLVIDVDDIDELDLAERLAASSKEVLNTSIVLQEVRTKKVLGVSAQNEEQAAALDLLMDNEIDLVALLGPAGTGKTLLTLISALADSQKYEKIIFTRSTVPVGDDIGFLPGTEEDKMAPWAGAIMDNLDFLKSLNKNGLEKVDDKLLVKSIAFMRGRTLMNTFLIIDEAQNLTPKQVKTLITRAGDGTKVILLGNLAQIDSPYLTETSSGLAYAVERFKGWDHFGSVILTKGKRSRLSNEGNVRL